MCMCMCIFMCMCMSICMALPNRINMYLLNRMKVSEALYSKISNSSTNEDSLFASMNMKMYLGEQIPDMIIKWE